MEVVEETFRQLLQKVWGLWNEQIFVYIDEDFAINSKSLLLTGKICTGVTERISLKNIIVIVICKSFFFVFFFFR